MRESSRKKLTNALISIGSTFATGVATYLCVPISVGAVTLAVLFAHEYGHFLAAWGVGGKPYMPIFIPLGFFAIGMTFTDKLNAEQRSIVSLAGPIAGLVVAAIIAAASLWFGMTWVTLLATLAGVFECWSLTVGGDGRRYRRARKGL